MKVLLGTKQRMTQHFTEEGVAAPATLLQAGPATVTQAKTAERDGYRAVQLGFGARKRVSKPLAGHLKGKGPFKWLREFRVAAEGDAPAENDTLGVSAFQEGDRVNVSSVSKGKGFQGVVKRHGFAGGPRTHGQKHSERAPGSIGATEPARVFKGTKMAGRMGGRRTTMKNLKVLAVDPDTNQMLVSGAIPGARGALVEIVGRS